MITGIPPGPSSKPIEKQYKAYNASIIETSFLIVLEAASLRSRCKEGCFLLKAPRGEFVWTSLLEL